MLERQCIMNNAPDCFKVQYGISDIPRAKHKSELSFIFMHHKFLNLAGIKQVPSIFLHLKF